MREERLENVKKEIRSVIITYPKGVALNVFRKTYHELVGARLPTREFGFTSDVDFLHSLKDVVKVQTDKNGEILLRCIVDENTEHIQKLVSKQRVIKPKNKKASGKASQERAPKIVPQMRPFVSASLRKYLFEVLEDFPDGINYNSLRLAYQKKLGRPLNIEFLSESKFDRLRKLEMAVPELRVKVVDETERLFYCPPIRSNGIKKNVESVHKVESTSNHKSPTNKAQVKGNNVQKEEIPIVSWVIKEDFERVLKLYPDGVLARHFPFLYEKMTGKMFDLADLGFNNFLELTDALPDVFICVKLYESPNEWMIFHTCFSESAEKLKKLNAALQLSGERFGPSTDSHQLEVPGDVTLEPYSPAEFPSDVDLSLYIPVFISAPINPCCFWFKLKIEEVMFRFGELEAALQSFYHNISADSYQMLPKDIKIGATCAAMHENHWYRTTITSAHNDELVKVFLVDYGSWEKVHCSKLCYLKKSFIALPSQAFKAELALIKPTDNSKIWSKKATARFLQLSIRSYIMAYVYNQLKDTLSVFLCDTSGDDDIDINQILVDEGLAESYSDQDRNLPQRSCFKDTKTCNEKAKSELNGFNGTSKKYADLESSPVNGNDSISTLNGSNLFNGVHLGDGYRANIIIISKTAYVTAADLCNLFWHDKSAEVLKSRLQCKNIEIPTVTIFRSEHKDLFLKCEKHKGFSPHQHSVEIYPLSIVMKILNSLGHPSLEVRETIKVALQDENKLRNLLKDSSYSHDASVNISSSEDDWSRQCLYDLKAMHEALKFKRQMLQKKLKETSETAIERDLMKAESLLKSIQERINDINYICSSYSIYE